MIRNYYKQLYASKFDNLGELQKFFGRHILPKFIHEDIDNLNISLYGKFIEFVVKNFTKKLQVKIVLLVIFPQMCKKQIITNSIQMSVKPGGRDYFPTFLMNQLYPNFRKLHYDEWKLHTNISHEHRYQNSKQKEDKLFYVQPKWLSMSKIQSIYKKF